MASEMKNFCEEPTKTWEDYSVNDLRCYLLQNMNKADCSFVVRDPENKSPMKVLESFQWILCGMSPVLNKMLNDKANQAQDCRLIPIADPNFEAIIDFAHTKRINEFYDDLLDLYESALNFDIPFLRNAVIEIFQQKISFGSLNWIKFFRIKCIAEKQGHSELDNIFCDWKRNLNNFDMERDLKVDANIETIVNFDIDTFDNFSSFITRLNPLMCFKITEAYIINNAFEGRKPNSPEKQGNIVKSFVKSFLKNIKFENMSRDEFQNGPGKSNLLDDALKKRILENIQTKKSYL